MSKDIYLGYHSTPMSEGVHPTFVGTLPRHPEAPKGPKDLDLKSEILRPEPALSEAEGASE